MLGFIGGLGPTEIIVVLALLLLLFGAKKLPELARCLGQGIREFRKSVKDIATDTTTNSDSDPSTKQS